MEILIRYEPPYVEKSGVRPIGCEKQVGGTGAGLKPRRNPSAIHVGQICSPRWNLRTESDGGLCSPSLRVFAIKAVLYQQHAVAKASSPDGWDARHIEVIREYRNENRQIKIVVEAPGEVEIGFMRKSRPGSQRNAARYSRHQTASGEDGIVGDESASRE